MAYAWILATYPKDYRRAHGAELLEPMLAESRRPTMREAADLLVHGLRTRLGRPTSRTVVVWAVLVTAIAGLFGAAAGSWVGWQTAGPLPPPASTRALLADVVPGRDFGPIEPPPASAFVLWDSELRWHDADDLLLGQGGGYQAASTVASTRLPADDVTPVAADAPARLAATGWRVLSRTSIDVQGCAGPPCDPREVATSTHLEATRDGLALILQVNPAHDRTDATVSVQFQHTTPAAARVGGAVGGLVVAVLTFLVFAWASRRTGRPDHPARLAVVFPFGVALLLWWGPTLMAAALVASSRSVGPWVEGPQLWEWIGQPRLSLLFVAGVAFAALSLLLSALPHRHELLRA